MTRWLVWVALMGLLAACHQAPELTGSEQGCRAGIDAPEPGPSGNLASLDACTAAADSAALPPERRAQALALRGTYLLHEGHLDQAVADADAAVRLAPDDPSVNHFRCAVLMAANQAAQAIAACSTAISVTPTGFTSKDQYVDLVRDHAARGAAYLCMGDPGHAIEDFDQWLLLVDRISGQLSNLFTTPPQLYPSALPYYLTGVAHAQLGDVHEAQLDTAKVRAANSGRAYEVSADTLRAWPCLAEVLSSTRFKS